MVLGNSSARGGASSPVSALYGGVAVAGTDTYTLQGVTQAAYASEGGAGLAPFIHTKLHTLGVANPRVDMWALSGWSSADILLWLQSANREQNDEGLYPDAVFYVQATPNNTTAQLLADFQVEFPLIITAIRSAWPGIPVYVASGTSDDPTDRPYWLELDQYKASFCAGTGYCEYVDIQGIDLDNTEHPTDAGFTQIVENLAEVW